MKQKGQKEWMRRAARARAQAGTRRGGRRGCCQLPRCGALSRAGLKGVDGKPKGLYLQNKINKAPPKLPVLCKGFCQLSPAQETHFTGWGGELKRRMHKLAEQEPQGKTHHRHKGTHMPCKKGLEHHAHTSAAPASCRDMRPGVLCGTEKASTSGESH